MNTESVFDETRKGQKRNKPDHDISLEERNNFQRSKLTPRTPTKERKPKEAADSNMEEIRDILIETKKEFKEDLAEIKKEI